MEEHMGYRRRRLPWALLVMIYQKLKYDKKEKKNIFKLCLVSRLKKKKKRPTKCDYICSFILKSLISNMVCSVYSKKCTSLYVQDILVLGVFI